MLGYSAREWLEQPPGFGFRIVVDEDRDRAQRDSEEAVKTGEDKVTEFRWQTKDGYIRWVENHLIPIKDNGNIVGLRGVALDITDRKLAEEQARRAEEKDKAILSAVPDLMFLQTLEGEYVDFHATDVADLFVAPEDFLGKNIRDIFPKELANRFLECFTYAKEGSEPEIIEYELEMGDDIRWYKARMVRTGDKILSIVRDISERKRAETQLAEAHGRRREILESIGDAFFSLDPERRFTYVNRKCEEIWGKKREDLLGKRVPMFSPGGKQRVRTRNQFSVGGGPPSYL